MAVRPRVIINAAMSVDGKIALPDGKGVRLSNEEDLRRVHRLRAAVDAILVGVGTVLKDDPKLTVKSEYAKGRNHSGWAWAPMARFQDLPTFWAGAARRWSSTRTKAVS